MVGPLAIPNRWTHTLTGGEVERGGTSGAPRRTYPALSRAAALATNTAQLSAEALARGLSVPRIGEHIQQARIQAVAKALSLAQDAPPA